mgnify:CR=1 FL=1
MEQVKEAFSKVKKDMDALKEEVLSLSKGLIETRESLIEICEVLKSLSKKVEEKTKPNSELNQILSKKEPNQISSDNPAHQAEIPTNTKDSPTHPENIIPQKPLNAQNTGISTGNEGVPTDRQTNQQTNQQTDKGSYNQDISLNEKKIFSSENSITNAAQILDSLDNLKKEIRLKFKRLTDQEFLVFSTIYQLSDEMGYTDYKNLSEKLNLTESSIRDYVGRLIKKGIPLEKIKINNKTIHILIPQNLKKIATLPTILQLRTI